MENKRVTIFTGNFGSGKTELSINYALKLNENYSNIVLADLDVVNPYFRSREKSEFLENKGIEVVYPKNLKHADLPIVSADVYKLIQNEEVYGVLDVGGNDDGAISLASVSKNLKDDQYEMNFVINTMRPSTNNIEGIIDMKKRIEAKSKLDFDNIICNINLGNDTTIKDIKNGYPLVKKASQKLNLPIKFIAIYEDLLPLPSDIDFDEEIFPIELYMNTPWN
ncbi:MAG: ATP-binding protein [Bacillota bacterium]